MKFKLAEGYKPYTSSGYSFSDEPTEVSEPMYIRKFSLHHQLVSVGEEPVVQVPVSEMPKQAEVVSEEPVLSEKDALRAELDEASIPYDKRWGVKKLREALNAD